MGSTPNTHAVSQVNHPVQQGFAAIAGVFITVLICSISAFVILSTGVPDGQTSGVALTQRGLTEGFGPMGNAYVALFLMFFSFSTIIGWFFSASKMFDISSVTEV